GTRPRLRQKTGPRILTQPCPTPARAIGPAPQLVPAMVRGAPVEDSLRTLGTAGSRLASVWHMLSPPKPSSVPDTESFTTMRTCLVGLGESHRMATMPLPCSA